MEKQALTHGMEPVPDDYEVLDAELTQQIIESRTRVAEGATPPEVPAHTEHNFD